MKKGRPKGAKDSKPRKKLPGQMAYVAVRSTYQVLKWWQKQSPTQRGEHVEARYVVDPVKFPPQPIDRT